MVNGPEKDRVSPKFSRSIGLYFQTFSLRDFQQLPWKKIYQYRITPFEKQEIEGNRENSFSLCGFDNLYRKKITAFSLFLRYRCLAPNVYLDAIFLSYLCISIVFV